MNHVEKLRELVAAGEKAPPGTLECSGSDIVYDGRYMEHDGTEEGCVAGDFELVAQGYETITPFFTLAANSRDSIAWALSVVDAAKEHRRTTRIADGQVQPNWREIRTQAEKARDALDILLAKETPDAT